MNSYKTLSLSLLALFMLISVSACAPKAEKPVVKEIKPAGGSKETTRTAEQSFNLDTGTYLSAREAFALAEAELKKLGRPYKLFTVVAASPVDSFMDTSGSANHWIFCVYFPGDPVVKGKTNTLNITIDRRYKDKFKIGQGYFDDMIVDENGVPFDIPDGWKDSPEVMASLNTGGGARFFKENFTEASYPSLNATHCNYRIRASLAAAEWRFLINAGKSDDPNYIRTLKSSIDAVTGKIDLFSLEP